MNTSRLIATVVASAAVLVAAPSAMAAQSYSLKVDGVAGESLVKGQEGAIDVRSFDFGFQAETSFLKGAGAAVGKPTPTPVTLTKNVDSTSPFFMTKIVQGQFIPAIELTVRTSGPAGSPVVNSRYCFTNVFVASQKYVGDGETQTEELKLVYKAMGQSQLNQTKGTNVFAGVDITTLQLLSGVGTKPCTI